MPTVKQNLSSNKHDRAGITLLAVGTDSESLRSLAEILATEDCSVQPAASCNEAMQAIRDNSPAIVACEGELPDGSWRDVVARVHDLAAPPPLIVMSRHADERLWAEVLNLGGYDVLAKPLERIEVARVMNAARRHGRAYRTA